MKAYLKGQLQAGVTGEEVLRLIDPLRVERIKQTDPHPVFKAFVVGHEGEHTFNLVGMGKKVVRWVREMVEELYDKIAVGTPIFNRHNPVTNAHDGREQIGEVVGKAYRSMGNKAHSVVAVYMNPKWRDAPLDVASIEADMGFDSDGTVLHPSLIEKITGIALGNSSVDSPGFPNATLLGTVQAFANEGKMEKTEVVQAVKDLKLGVTDLFTLDEVMADTKVDGRVKEANKDVYSHAKRVETEVGALRAEVVTLKNAHAEELKGRDQEVGRYKSRDRFGLLLTDRKLTESQRKFAEKNWEAFKPSTTDKAGLDVELNSFIDTQLAAYKEYAVMFGVKVDDASGSPTGAVQVPKVVPPSPAVTGSVLPPTAINPATNDFIPQPITPGKDT